MKPFILSIALTLAVQIPNSQSVQAVRSLRGGEHAMEIAYSTYLGTDDCAITGAVVAADDLGGTYVAGSVFGDCFPMKPGAFQEHAPAGIQHGFVAKVSPDGTRSEWATYIGGDSATSCSAVAVDAQGNVVVTGTSRASDLPFGDGFQPAPRETSAGDVFVAMLDPTGSTLLYGTYLGGGASESASAVAVDTAGRIVVVGSTTSSDFPTTPDAIPRTYPGSSDIGFVTVVDATRTGAASLYYSTLLGGSQPGNNFSANGVAGVAVSRLGTLYVCGSTNAADFPQTPGSIPAPPPGPAGVTGFFSEIDPSRTGFEGLRYSTLVGGSGQSQCSDVAVDSAGVAFLAGSTGSTDFPVSPGAFQSVHRGGWDAFVLELNPSAPDGERIVHSTFIGGTGTDRAISIDVQEDGLATVACRTGSVDFPLRGSLVDPESVAGVGGDAVLQLEPSGSDLRTSTRVPGGTLQSATVDESGVVHASLGTLEGGLPVTPGALQSRSPDASTGPVSALVRITESSTEAHIAKPADIEVTASVVSNDTVGSVVEFPMPVVTGDNANRAAVVFDPPSGTFLRSGHSHVLAYAIVGGSITSVTSFGVIVGIAYDTCLSETSGVRFHIVADPGNPIRGTWLLEADSDDDTLYVSGVADSVRVDPDVRVVFTDTLMRARLRFSSGVWKVIVKVRRSGQESPVIYRIKARPGACG